MAGNQDAMAQAYFLAQLEAAKGVCKCNACRILRKANVMMTKQFLGEAPEGAGQRLPESEAGVLGQTEEE